MSSLMQLGPPWWLLVDLEVLHKWFLMRPPHHIHCICKDKPTIVDADTGTRKHARHGGQ